jgi:hypothetical protein
LLRAAQHDADARWQLYEQIAGVHRVVTDDHAPAGGGDAPPKTASTEEPAP